jgi:hypothetical protein
VSALVLGVRRGLSECRRVRSYSRHGTAMPATARVGVFGGMAPRAEGWRLVPSQISPPPNASTIAAPTAIRAVGGELEDTSLGTLTR